MVLWYAYLHSVDEKKSTAILKIHIIINVYDNEDGDHVPVTAGLFEHEVSFPYPVRSIPNSMLCETASKYLSRTWLKEIVLWTWAMTDLLQFVLKKHVYGNNVHGGCGEGCEK